MHCALAVLSSCSEYITSVDIYSLLHGILSARQKKVNFQTNNDGLQNSVCLENMMPTPKLVRFEIPNNKHHAQ